MPTWADADRANVATLAREATGARDVEVALRDRAGATRQALLRIKAVELQGEPSAISIMRDISAQRQAEKQEREQRVQLTHLTRVASLTEFSSTLAHELNQPLTAILSNAQAALRFLAHDPPNVTEIRTILSEIVEADKRAGQLIHHLRLLMKKADEEFVPHRAEPRGEGRARVPAQRVRDARRRGAQPASRATCRWSTATACNCSSWC